MEHLVQIDVKKHEIHLKLVYYGCGESGKTTSLYAVKRYLQTINRNCTSTKTISISTSGGRTLYYDYQFFSLNREILSSVLEKFGIQLDLTWLGDFNLGVHGWAATGQDFYAPLRAPVVKGADTIVFVIDSQREKFIENKRSLEELKKFFGEKLNKKIPVVVQLNKRDLWNIYPSDFLIKNLRLENYLVYETVATQAKGTIEAFLASVLLAIQSTFS